MRFKSHLGSAIIGSCVVASFVYLNMVPKTEVRRPVPAPHRDYIGAVEPLRKEYGWPFVAAKTGGLLYSSFEYDYQNILLNTFFGLVAAVGAVVTTRLVAHRKR